MFLIYSKNNVLFCNMSRHVWCRFVTLMCIYCYGLQVQLRLYSDGDMPTCSLKYLPRNDWLEKLRL